MSWAITAPSPSSVVLTIDVPQTAEPGGHYAAALCGSRAQWNGDTQVVGKVGTLLLFKEGLAVSLSAGRLAEAGPINLQVRSENTGNVHVKPEGELTVSPVLWGDERSLPVPAENVFPSSVRESTVRLDELPIGIYRASVRVTYGSGKVLAASEPQTFVVLPWKLVLGALGIFLLGGLGSLGLTRMLGWRRHAVAGPSAKREDEDPLAGVVR